jgi:archaellum biogenesis ATPase FlaH
VFSIRGRDIFTAAFADCTGVVELRALPGAARVFVPTHDYEAIARFLREHRGRDLYFGVATRRDETNGTTANCAELGALFVDIDARADDLDTVRRRLAELPTPPSILITSGGGFHAYWLLREPLDLRSEAEAARHLLRRLARAVGGDLSSAEVARVLRVPGTLNHKYTPPRRVAVLDFQPDRRYTPSDFGEWLPDEPREAVSVTRFTVPERVREGERNTMLWKLGRALKAKGLNAAAVVHAVRAANDEQCEPPLPQREVEQIIAHALTASDRVTTPPPATTSRRESLALVSLRDLLAEPDAATDWLVEDRIPVGGLALLVGKPKAGKSTLSRALALAVARGDSWLGWACRQGLVVYIALEDRRADVRRHFRTMGATGEEPIHFVFAAQGEDAIAQLQEIVARERVVLVIIDTLQRLLRAKDLSDYAEVTTRLTPLLSLARETGAAVVFVHHAGKSVAREAVDMPLGSTALAGSVDSVLVLRRQDGRRTLESVQRVGTDLEPILVTLDDAGRPVPAGSLEEAERQQLEGELLEALAHADRPLSREDWFDQVEGRRAVKLTAFRRLVEAGRVVYTGTGRRGDPRCYSLPSQFPVPPVPTISWEPEKPESKIAVSDCAVEGNSGSRKRGDLGTAGNRNSVAGTGNDDAETPPFGISPEPWARHHRPQGGAS